VFRRGERKGVREETQEERRLERSCPERALYREKRKKESGQKNRS